MRNILRLTGLALMCACAGSAVDWKALKPAGYVTDFAGVVDPASRDQLERYAAAVEQATGTQMAFVTLRSLEGEPIEDVANTIYRAWGVGQKGKNEGLLLLLSIGDRRMRVEVGYGLEPVLPDGFVGRVQDEMRPALRAGQYGEAVLAAAQTMGASVAQAKGVAIDTQIHRRIRRTRSNTFPWPLLIGGAVLLAALLMRGGPRGYGGGGWGGGGGGGFLPGLILGGVLGRQDWGGRGGGGFGGYDSGDGGFGGFGGGDSGGGGASSDW